MTSVALKVGDQIIISLKDKRRVEYDVMSSDEDNVLLGFLKDAEVISTWCPRSAIVKLSESGMRVFHAELATWVRTNRELVWFVKTTLRTQEFHY